MVSLSPNIAPSNPSSSVTPLILLETISWLYYYTSDTLQVYSNSHFTWLCQGMFPVYWLINSIHKPLIYPDFILFHSLNKSCTSPYFCVFSVSLLTLLPSLHLPPMLKLRILSDPTQKLCLQMCVPNCLWFFSFFALLELLVYTTYMAYNFLLWLCICICLTVLMFPTGLQILLR